MPSSAVVLEVVDGPDAGKVFTYRGHETFVLGRSDSATLRPENDFVVSRNHLQIEIDPPRCFVRDLKSANGTYVNGERIAERWLVNGDTISGGKTMIRVRIEEIEDEPVALNEILSEEHSVAKTDLMQLPPAIIGEYQLAEQIGVGSSGVVHKAIHRLSGDVVAVKLIAPSMIKDDSVVTSMLREAAVLCQLNHKRIVRFIETGVVSGYLYLMMEYVDTVDLMHQLRRMPTNTRIRVACGVMRQVLDGLSHAHGLGLIHRDIKPGNILISQQDNGFRAKLADFGLAKSFLDAGLSRFSGENEIKGTLNYMAPEQIENSRYATPAADLFSIGASLYTLICDNQIYNTSDGRISIDTILKNGPIPIEQRMARVPPELTAVLNRALAYQASARYGSAAEMRAALTPLAQR